MLPKEKRFGPNEILAIAWSLAWRIIVVGIPLFLITKLLPKGGNSAFLEMLISLFELVANLGAYWLAVYWLFRNGRFGNNKIIVMEQADYQKLDEQLAPNVQHSGAPVSLE
ncbi:MAG: hypothetical protein ABL877_08160 [Thiobacillus sp.]